MQPVGFYQVETTLGDKTVEKTPIYLTSDMSNHAFVCIPHLRPPLPPTPPNQC